MKPRVSSTILCATSPSLPPQHGCPHSLNINSPTETPFGMHKPDSVEKRDQGNPSKTLSSGKRYGGISAIVPIFSVPRSLRAASKPFSNFAE